MVCEYLGSARNELGKVKGKITYSRGYLGVSGCSLQCVHLVRKCARRSRYWKCYFTNVSLVPVKTIVVQGAQLFPSMCIRNVPDMIKSLVRVRLADFKPLMRNNLRVRTDHQRARFLLSNPGLLLGHKGFLLSARLLIPGDPH